MAFPSPAVTTGQLATASAHNSDVKDNLNSLYAGAMSISSQATADFIYASSATQLGRLAAVALKVPQVNSAGTGWTMVDAGAGEYVNIALGVQVFGG